MTRSTKCSSLWNSLKIESLITNLKNVTEILRIEDAKVVVVWWRWLMQLLRISTIDKSLIVLIKSLIEIKTRWRQHRTAMGRNSSIIHIERTKITAKRRMWHTKNCFQCLSLEIFCYICIFFGLRGSLPSSRFSVYRSPLNETILLSR